MKIGKNNHYSKAMEITTKAKASYSTYGKSSNYGWAKKVDTKTKVETKEYNATSVIEQALLNAKR